MLIHNKILYGASALIGIANIAYGIHFCLENHHVAAIACLIGGASSAGISLKKIITGESEYLNVHCYFSKHRKKTGEEKGVKQPILQEQRQQLENIASPSPALISDYDKEVFKNLPATHIQATENKQLQNQVELQIANN